MFHVLLLLACAVAIYVACEWFVNAVEWLGVRLEVGPVAVGTILAAAGTALPESVVTLVAVLFGSPEHGDDIAVGAALGGPLVVGTIAYGVTGGMLIWRSAGSGPPSPRPRPRVARGLPPTRGRGSPALRDRRPPRRPRRPVDGPAGRRPGRGRHGAAGPRPGVVPRDLRGQGRARPGRLRRSSRGSASSSSRSTPCTSGGR